MIRIAICDDDRDYAEWMKERLTGLSCEGVQVALYSSGEDLLTDMDIPYELIFLDVEMPGIDGTETARRIRGENRNAVLVFVSGVRNPTPESFKVAPYRYLLKQFQKDKMERELREILEETGRAFSGDFLTCMRNGAGLRVNLRYILYFSIRREECLVHIYPVSCGFGEGAVTVRRRIKELGSELEEKDFAFAHNSYLVNLRQVASFSKTEVVLKDRSVLTVSRSRYAEFEQRLFDYWGRKYP